MPTHPDHPERTRLAESPKPVRRGTKALLVASGVAQICALARYTILARLLGPEQLGLAAILILTAQFFDSVTDSGSDRFLVQDSAGSAPALLRLTHLVSLGDRKSTRLNSRH